MSVHPTVKSELQCRQTVVDEADCDCESESSEVLSVGNEPPPAITDASLVMNDGIQSPRSLRSPSSDPVSPESPTSSYGMAASSPGRAEFGQDASLPGYPPSTIHHQMLKYQQHREPELEYTTGIMHGLAQETVCPCVEQLHRTPINVLSLLQAASCRGRPAQQLQQAVNNVHGHLHQVPVTALHHHRLSVSKLLQRESSELSNSREEPQLLLSGVGNSLQSSITAPSNNCNINNSSTSTSNGNNNNRSNNSNSTQHQTNLKFSIDNILKAEFGRRITDPISFKKSRSKKLMTRPVDLSKDFLESSSEGSERGSEKGSDMSTRNVSPSLPACSPAPNVTPTTATDSSKLMQWPAWVYCTRYSDRPSSGPRTRRTKVKDELIRTVAPEEKRPRTAFSIEQLARLKREFAENKYLTEQRRQALSKELGLNEAQIKIWFQNKRAKIKKASGQKNPLALQLMAQGLYNHSTVPLSKDELEQAAELQANGM